MTRLAFALVLAGILSAGSVFGQEPDFAFSSREEQALITHWESHRTLPRGILECLLVAEGADGQLSRCASWIAPLETEAKKRVDPEGSFERKGEQLFEFLHERVLRKYSARASAEALMAGGEYSCVTAAALYYHLGTLAGLRVTFHATPFHVSPILESDGRKIWIEMTQPNDGFDVEYYDPELVDELVEQKIIARDELDRKGRETVYNEFVQGHFQPSAASLLGYHYYNHALKLDERGKTEEAFWALAKAHALEPGDEGIQRVLDYAFVNLSTLEHLESSYARAAREYFRARGRDSTAVEGAIEGAYQGVSVLIRTGHDIAQAESVLTTIEGFLTPRERGGRGMTRLRQFVGVSRGREFGRRGQHQEAFGIFAAELRRDSTAAWLQDLYIESGVRYAEKLHSAGKVDQALALIDSIYLKMPSYDKLKEVYIRFTLYSVMSSHRYRTSPVAARESLMRGFRMDSTNAYVRNALATVYHELAMNEIRKSNWNAARSQIMQGLRFDPGNEYLNSDLELLRKERPKSTK